MTTFQKALYFFILPLVAVLLYPPQTLGGGAGVLIVVVVLFALLASFLWRGFGLALTFSIFTQGMNVIIRLMMFFSNGFTEQGSADTFFIITSILGLVLSFYLLLRLDKQDIRLQMVR